ncbi:hypothetical protein AGMMS4957_03080 [Bacteroidia bacterium]|nr:hypothetical protein AGMMS4957_03080 [Bacteroidia bacterium]
MSDGAFESLKFLFGITADKSAGKISIDKQQVKIPFAYKIAHKQNKFRELAIIHPLNQVQVVEFYEKYKTLILHYCKQSNFSIRRPDKVACYFYYKDRLHEQLLGKKVDSKEEYLSEYENLKSYFSYQDYANIYKFYEDYHYQRAEKKFQKLLKFDIQDCFNSIYTHSIVWATLGGKEQAKHAFLHGQSQKDTFGDHFDNLMQKMNHDETNGILIGPEFSRIFAEIILQKIDKDVENCMIAQKKYNKTDYECYRYVDDYFLFYNDEDTKNKICEYFSLALKEYKMTISDAKTKLYEKPFITDVTMAKLKVDALIVDCIQLKIKESTVTDETDPAVEIDTVETISTDDNPKFKKEKLLEYLQESKSLYINPNTFIAKYKSIIKESNVEYKNILNYSLARIAIKLETVLKQFDQRFKYFSYYTKHSELLTPAEKKQCTKIKTQDERNITSFVCAILDIVFFLYSNNKRINTTLKILSILNVVILYFKNNYMVTEGKFIRFSNTNIEVVFKKIQDEINLVMQTTPFKENTQLESFYLLLALKEMGNEYGITQDTINKYLCLEDKDSKDCKWNVLLIFVLLHYYSDDEKYQSGRRFLQKVILSKIKAVDSMNRILSTELTILKMDILTCPYLDEDLKKRVLRLFGITDSAQVRLILNYAKKQQSWFIKWIGFNLNYEINAKVSQEVYS